MPTTNMTALSVYGTCTCSLNINYIIYTSSDRQAKLRAPNDFKTSVADLRGAMDPLPIYIYIYITAPPPPPNVPLKDVGGLRPIIIDSPSGFSRPATGHAINHIVDSTLGQVVQSMVKPTLG